MLTSPSASSAYLMAVALSAWKRLLGPPGSDRLTVWLFLRGLGLIYAVAFLSLALQLPPLLGRDGLLPVQLYLERIAEASLAPWWDVPSLMWISSGDGFMLLLAWSGVALGLLLLSGHASAIHLLLLWILYSSFVNVGQLFYSYGWEILLLETGFLAVFLCPVWRGGWRGHVGGCERIVLWLLRWLLFRVLFGAGLIKLRGDPCWRDLTCLLYHYETQPIPNPISPYLHALPAFVHHFGVLFNHLVEVVVPVFYFAPYRMRRIAGGLTVLFQVLLVLSGNLSWLNWLTLVLCVPCFDDGLLHRILPASLIRRTVDTPSDAPSPMRGVATAGLLVLILSLSISPVINLLSPGQMMNTSFDRLHLVNTYGAFGHIGKERDEIILLGTLDNAHDAAADWREYEFPCKPGDPSRPPCVVSPYHHRLDWQIWFAAMGDYRTQPWLLHLVYKLLHADPEILGLLASDPFGGRRPRWIRADLYRYEFAPPVEDGWWRRRRLGPYLPPLSARDPSLQRIVESFGWPLLSSTTVSSPPCACSF
ncbi:MAG: lipase maturation factor family protein [Candidatus Latescibacterota bacterium]|nr:lipase maturation factor family protein [Candidatus Latescibacterota bacterium]